MKKTIRLLLCFSILSVFSLVSCADKPDYYFYLIGPDETQEKLEFLFKTLEKQDSSEGRFIINLEVSRIMVSLNQNALRNAYLLEQIQWYPNDFCNSYYLNMIANDYQSRRMPQMAEVYYKRIMRNYPPIQAKGQSIQENVLKNLSQICAQPEEKIFYSTSLLEQFPNEKEAAKTYYTLASGYERLGQWEEAMNTWKKFLNAPSAGMEGEEKLRKEISKKVRFYEYSPKNWAYRELEDLLYAVRTAIRNKDNDAIKRNMSKIDFFTLSWAQEEKEADYNFVFNLATYMRGRPIAFSSTVERNATDTAAYWETYNWRYRIRNWYLYFRRIDFPADPSLHGKWEWAGIYFGEKPFKSAR